MNRLESLAPEIARAISVASSDKRREAATAVALEAARLAGLANPEGVETIALLGQNAPIPTALRMRMSQLVTQLDEQYFKAQEDGDESASLELFGKARAAAALLYAVDALDMESAFESIYEATATADDPTHLLEIARTVLQSS